MASLESSPRLFTTLLLGVFLIQCRPVTPPEASLYNPSSFEHREKELVTGIILSGKVGELFALPGPQLLNDSHRGQYERRGADVSSLRGLRGGCTRHRQR